MVKQNKKFDKVQFPDGVASVTINMNSYAYEYKHFGQVPAHRQADMFMLLVVKQPNRTVSLDNVGFVTWTPNGYHITLRQSFNGYTFSTKNRYNIP
jgi:hypothetical protein